MWIKEYTHRGWRIESMAAKEKYGRKFWLLYNPIQEMVPLTADTLKEARKVIDQQVCALKTICPKICVILHPLLFRGER